MAGERLARLGQTILGHPLFGHPWERSAFVRCWPSRPDDVFRQMARAGFSAREFRGAAPDLMTGLPSDDWAPKFYLRYLEHEVSYIRFFPIRVDFIELERLAAMHMRDRKLAPGLVRNLVQAQIDSDANARADAVFWRGAIDVAGKVGAPAIFIGDSHSRIYRQTIGRGRNAIVPLNIACAGGSALGLGRADSRSGYGASLREILRAVAAAQSALDARMPICLAFGQVDIEFVDTFRRLRGGRLDFDPREFARFCDEAADSYLDWAAALGLRNLAILGVNPPCLRDDMLVGAYDLQMRAYQSGGIVDDLSFEDLLARLPDMRLPDFAMRTRCHRIFNAALAAGAHRRGLRYFDDFDGLLGADGRLAPRFSSTVDGSDIHIGGRAARNHKAKLVRRIIAQTSPGKRAPTA